LGYPHQGGEVSRAVNEGASPLDGGHFRIGIHAIHYSLAMTEDQ